MKNKLKNILHFLVGTLRYKLFYSKFDFLLGRTLKNQIQFRIDVMDDQCYKEGSCKICGCTTTALQMADKQCPKPCYPPFFDKKTWWMFWGQEKKVLGNGDWWQVKTKFNLEMQHKLYRTLTLLKNDRIVSQKIKLHKDYARKSK